MKIKKLSPLVISQIAAGEVVERPASIVKELIENALDAGADRIYIRVEEGGQKSILIIDNGSGIEKDDLPLVFERHATSKFEKFSDFQTLTTFGFRGEAIASIAAVSQVTIETSTDSNESIGYKMQVFGGEVVLEPTLIGRTRGTSVLVENLFYNTPARKKFLKNASREMSMIAELVTKYALIHSNVQFILEQKGKEYLRSYGDSQPLTNIRFIYGKDSIQHMQRIEYVNEENGIRIEGYISNGELAKKTKKHQTIAINGRLVQNPLLFDAVEESVRAYMPPGMNPIVVMNIMIPNRYIDVNAHPRKELIRFQDEETISSVIQEAISNSLSILQEKEQALNDDRVSLEYDLSDINKDILSFKILGQLKNTYIMVEIFDKIMVIDQHAAHEAIIYHYLKESVLYKREEMGRDVLENPVIVDITPAQEVMLQKHIEDINKMGFLIEPFGRKSLIVREVPKGIDHEKTKMVVEEILNEGISNKTDWLRNSLILTSCKSAIKANQELSEETMNYLVRELILNQITNCPHGRPLYFTMSISDLERKFNRVI